MNTEQCTEITDNSIPLRQGDILLFPKKEERERYGIVVTGDCDIAQKKCRRIISYCTITTANYYISTEVMYDAVISKEINKLEESVLKNVYSQLKAERSETFLSTLLTLESSDLNNLLKDKNLIMKIEMLKSIKDKIEYSMADCIAIYKMNNKNSVNDDELIKIKGKFLSKLNSLPGDKYHISEIPNQNDDYGYIVHLRYINTISQDDIEKQNNLYRIGHLEAPYLYKLTQKLGAIFSDIGEPEEFEKNKLEINKMIIEEL
ncbi:hypothetical protein [uncultured Treponema sp.]|uniref:hypothetical protein n=1 Tax=uncultured Treponema sp. TaxID=162155 RepID=UPI0028EDE214|nr:hypothetical protein [uncultured Treponema sp.]